MAISDKQVAANRRNAKKSTGPKSAEGKARSSHNAVKSGIWSSSQVITRGDGQESQEAYNEFVEGMYEYWMPVGVAEEMLVKESADYYWRLQRTKRAEVGAIHSHTDNLDHSNLAHQRRRLRDLPVTQPLAHAHLRSRHRPLRFG